MLFKRKNCKKLSELSTEELQKKAKNYKSINIFYLCIIVLMTSLMIYELVTNHKGQSVAMSLCMIATFTSCITIYQSELKKINAELKLRGEA